MRTVKSNVVEEEMVLLCDIYQDTPIFAKKDGRLVGMLVYEPPDGWIIRLGGECGATGFYTNRETLIREACDDWGYTFHVEE